MPAAMPCKIRGGKYKETCRTPNTPRTKHACIVEADESTRKRLEGTLLKDHEDHTAGKGVNSLNHYNLVHKFMPLLKAMKNTRCESSGGERMEKSEKIPARQRTKVRDKDEVIAEARHEGRKVHFASLMDLCHLRNSELEAQSQNYKCRVVLRGDIVKDDSGLYAALLKRDHQHHK